MTILSSWHNRLFFIFRTPLLSVSTDLTPDFPDCAATTLRVGLLSFFANESDQKREQMAVYRDDPDLQFLGQCDNEALDLLVRLITHDPRDCTLRWTETLSGSDNYRRFHPAHRNYWPEIAAEIRTFGASSIVSVFRGEKGVLYREMLSDVCDHVGVKYEKEIQPKPLSFPC
jgi:hypothetical protein